MRSAATVGLGDCRSCRCLARHGAAGCDPASWRTFDVTGLLTPVHGHRRGGPVMVPPDDIGGARDHDVAHTEGNPPDLDIAQNSVAGSTGFGSASAVVSDLTLWWALVEVGEPQRPQDRPGAAQDARARVVADRGTAGPDPAIADGSCNSWTKTDICAGGMSSPGHPVGDAVSHPTSLVVKSWACPHGTVGIRESELIWLRIESAARGSSAQREW